MTHLTDCNCIQDPYLDNKVNLHSTTPSLFKRTVSNILKIKNSILFTILFVALGQVCLGLDKVGDYRSFKTGYWTTLSTWQIYNGSTWDTPQVIPGPDNKVTILSSHTITVNGECDADTLTINLNGNVITQIGKLTVKNATIKGKITLAKNDNFNVSSFLNVTGSVDLSGTCSVGGNVIIGGTITINAAGGIFNATSNVTVNKSGIVDISGTFTSGSDILIDGKATVKNGGTITIAGSLTSSGTTVVSGTFKVKDNLTIDGTLTVNAGGIFSVTNNTTVTTNGTANISGTFNSGIDILIDGHATVESGGNITIAGKMTGSGTTSVSGIFKVHGSVLIDGSLNINAGGGTFNAMSNSNITEFGAADVKGIFTVGNDVLIDGLVKVESGGIFTVTGTMTGIGITNVIGSFKVSGNAILSGKATVEAGGNFDVTGIVKLENTDCLSLLSFGGATGSFTFGSKDATSTGNAVVERKMSDTDKWHLYSSPLSGETIHDFLKFNNEVPNLVSGGNIIGVGMRKYNDTTDVWSPYFIYGDGLPIGDMTVGKGFSIRTIPDSKGSLTTNPGCVYSHGTLNSNYVTVALKSYGNHWNCIGNPFTSAINLNPSTLGGTDGLLNPANLSKLDDGEFQAVYVWDANDIMGNGNNPSYVILNDATTINSLQIGQGFFVKSNKNNTNSISDTIRFTKSMQSPNSSLSFKNAEIEWPSLKIVVKNLTLSSSTEIKFVSNTTIGLDPGYDAGMLKANPDFALYTKLLVDNPVDFGLQCLPAINFDQYVIPIGIDSKVASDITFKVETVNLPSGCQALLEDRLTKQFTRLDLKDAKYTTTVSANTKGTGRFFLHTSDMISGDQPIEKEPFKISKIGKTVYINGEVSDKANFFVYSLNGKQLANFKAESQVQNQFDASGLPAGVYILTCDDQNQKKSTKFVIEN